MTLEERAASIPHMGARNIGDRLRQLASEAKASIVECGSWLGSGTAYLALGAKQSGVRLHTYDKFRANDSEIVKAAAFGLTLEHGQNTLPIVREYLRPFDVDIEFHRGGMEGAEWCGDPIDLFVLDAAKRSPAFPAVVETFWPYLCDGARLVLMDFHHYERGGDRYREQQRFMAQHPEYEPVEDRIEGDSSAALFVFRKPK